MESFTQPTPQPRPKTPEPPSKKQKIDEIRTPQKPADVHACFQILWENNQLTRGENLLMRKLAKSIGQLQAQLAEKTIANEAQKLQIERLSGTKKRKKVPAEPNSQFSNVKAVKRAREEVEVVSANEAANRAQREERASRNHENSLDQRHTYSSEDCLFEFEI